MEKRIGIQKDAEQCGGEMSTEGRDEQGKWIRKMSKKFAESTDGSIAFAKWCYQQGRADQKREDKYETEVFREIFLDCLLKNAFDSEEKQSIRQTCAESWRKFEKELDKWEMEDPSFGRTFDAEERDR